MKDLYLCVVNGESINSSISSSLKENWEKVKGYLERLRARGIKAREDVIANLRKAFSWMTQDDAVEAFYQYYFAAASVNRIESSLLDRITDKYPFADVVDNTLILDKTLPNQDHEYLEYDLENEKVNQVIGKRFSGINVGDSLTEEQLEAILVRLNSIESSKTPIVSRRGGADAPRMEFFRFLQTIPSITTPPATKNNVGKDDYTGSSDKDEYAAYYYTFLAPDGANYSVEFLVDLVDSTGEIWVEDETKGSSLGHFPVDDVLDLGDYEARFVEDMLSAAIGEGPKNSRASDKTFGSVDRLKEFYKRSKISRDDAISTLIDQFDYSSEDAINEVTSWGKNYYESTHKVSANLKRQTRFRKFISSRVAHPVTSAVGDHYYGHVIPEGEPNAGNYAVTDENGDVLGIFPDKDAASAAGYVNV